MSSVTFLQSVGGDGSTVTDDADSDTGLANGGHRTRFVPALSNVVSIAAYVVQKAAEAAAAAASALGGLGSIATSSTPLSVGAADIVLDVGTGKTFAPGQKVGVARTSAPSVTAMYGTVLTYSGSTLTVRIAAGDFIGSGGPYGDWTISPTLYGPSNARTISAAGLATGGGDLSANRTITVPAAVDADMWVGTAADKAVTPDALSDMAKLQTITYGATVTWATATQGNQGYLLMAGNPAIANPTGLKDGWTYLMMIDQGAVGNRTVSSWGSIFEWGLLGVPTLSTGANKIDMLIFIYSSITGKLHLMSFRRAA